MTDDRLKIFRLLETADNFIKYASPGRGERAVDRARRRYERARKLAERAGDAELVEQARLRLEDLERRALLPTDEPDGWTGDAPTVVSSELPDHAASRVPPGQRVTRGWPVLHTGGVPRFDPSSWRMRVRGEVKDPIEITYDDVRALPEVELQSDFHCVTGWSKLDNTWIGVRVRDLLDVAKPSPDATHSLVTDGHDYSANLPLDLLTQDDALLAWGHNGENLQPKHGWPLRLVVPSVYAWKSVKWVQGFELLNADRRGYWEIRGYHNDADPWREERYSFQESR